MNDFPSTTASSKDNAKVKTFCVLLKPLEEIAIDSLLDILLLIKDMAQYMQVFNPAGGLLGFSLSLSRGPSFKYWRFFFVHVFHIFFSLILTSGPRCLKKKEKMGKDIKNVHTVLL